MPEKEPPAETDDSAVSKGRISQVGNRIFLKEPKTPESQAEIAVPAVLVEKLIQHREHQKIQKMMALGAYDDQGLVCADELGQPLYPDKLSWMFHYYVDKAGLPPMRLHDLRHHVAGVLGRIVDGKTVSGLLRHTSVKATFDLYRDKNLEAEREAIEEYGRLMQGDI